MINFDELDLLTCVNLNNIETRDPSDPTIPPRKVYHGIYASQLYGTLFGIYGKFLLDQTTKPGWCLLTGIDLKLLNYKGVINIGFPAAKSDVTVVDNVVNFSIQATIPNYETVLQFDKPIEVERGHFVRVIFNRELLAIPQFELSSQDIVNQNNIAQLRVPKSSDVPLSPFFDTEFHYRDGVDYYDQMLRPGMADFSKSSRGNMVFSLRCTQSNVNVLYS